MITRRSFLALSSLAVGAAAQPAPSDNKAWRFAVLGDTGTGGSDQFRVGERLALAHSEKPFNTVVMVGDNLYGGESTSDYVKKFERPYAALLEKGVKFYASLGNHDNPSQRFYEKFNMGGKRYYSFKPQAGIRFFALDSNYMDAGQLDWLDKELAASGSEWKIPFFHHPLYSSGATHGSAVQLRAVLEPLFVKHNVLVVLAGHEHFYERIRPQHGITYFTVGSSAKLRRGDIRPGELTAKSFDRDNAFMLCDVEGNSLKYQVLSKTGAVVDSGGVEAAKTS